MVVAIGQISLIIAFIVTFYSSLAGFFSGKIKNNNLFDSGKLAFYSVIPLLLISTASLIYSFENAQFNNILALRIHVFYCMICLRYKPFI